MTNDTDEGLVCAYVMDGNGGGRALDWKGLRAWRPEDGVLWVHLDRSAAESRRWLREESGVDEVTCEALLAEETRPRSLVQGEAALVILRGVNLNPGAEPEDMISLRLWIEPGRIISLRRLRVMAVQDIRDRLAAGEGPDGPGGFLALLAERLIDRMSGVIDDLDDSVDALEEEVLTGESYALRPRIAELRRETIRLRRYLAPQRDVMSRLTVERVGWLDEAARGRLRETADRVTRFVEDLDSARERAQVTQDELASRLSEQMNRNMYILTVVAAILLPLSFITGLLGINVGGIPGAETTSAFAIVIAVLAVLAGLQVWLFRRFGWI